MFLSRMFVACVPCMCIRRRTCVLCMYVGHVRMYVSICAFMWISCSRTSDGSVVNTLTCTSKDLGKHKCVSDVVCVYVDACMCMFAST